MSSFRSRRGLVPKGLLVEQATVGPDGVLIVARTGATTGVCPRCGARSASTHSRYERLLADFPAHGRVVRLRVRVRRFRCAESGCPQRIFAERLDPSAAAPYARRTARLHDIVHHLGVALGGRPGQRTARRLLTPVSKDTLLRMVRARAEPYDGAPRVVGVDDWAWRKGHRYGTVICDLEQRRIIDVLPDRDAASVTAWLSGRPSIEIIARDRGGGYGQAASLGRPEARQVADRWHLFENASAAFLGAVRRSMREVRQVLFVEVSANVLHIALDLLLVLGSGWGIKGVAIATLVSEALKLLLLAAIAARNPAAYEAVRSFARRATWQRSELVRLFALNRDLFARTLLLTGAMMLFARTGAQSGPVTLAANGILFQLFMLATLLLDGFENEMVPPSWTVWRLS